MPLNNDELQTLACRYMGKLMLDAKTREAADGFTAHDAPGGAQKHHQQVADLINNDPELRLSSPITAEDADDLHTYMHDNLQWFLEPLDRMNAAEAADGVHTQHCPAHN